MCVSVPRASDCIGNNLIIILITIDDKLIKFLTDRLRTRRVLVWTIVHTRRDRTTHTATTRNNINNNNNDDDDDDDDPDDDNKTDADDAYLDEDYH